jgi:hypothetical protein
VGERGRIEERGEDTGRRRANDQGLVNAERLGRQRIVSSLP